MSIIQRLLNLQFRHQSMSISQRILNMHRQDHFMSTSLILLIMQTLHQVMMMKHRLLKLHIHYQLMSMMIKCMDMQCWIVKLKLLRAHVTVGQCLLVNYCSFVRVDQAQVGDSAAAISASYHIEQPQVDSLINDVILKYQPKLNELHGDDAKDMAHEIAAIVSADIVSALDNFVNPTTHVQQSLSSGQEDGPIRTAGFSNPVETPGFSNDLIINVDSSGLSGKGSDVRQAEDLGNIGQGLNIAMSYADLPSFEHGSGVMVNIDSPSSTHITPLDMASPIGQTSPAYEGVRDVVRSPPVAPNTVLGFLTNGNEATTE